MYRTCGQCCVFRMWVLGSNIVIIRTVRTGHVVSVVCSDILVVGSYIVIGLYVLDKWSVLCVLYVGGGI